MKICQNISCDEEAEPDPVAYAAIEGHEQVPIYLCPAHAELVRANALRGVTVMKR